MNYLNDVVLQGIVVNKIVTPKTAVLFINTGSATKVANFPKVVCFGALRDKVVADVKKGNRVRVLGNVQSSIPNENNKDRDLLTIFADEVTPAQSLMSQSFNVESASSYKPFENSIKLAGSVVKIRQLTDNLFNVVVFTKKNDRVSFVTVSHYTKTPEAFVNSVKVKDAVYVLGNVQTVKKEIKGEIHYFQNYVATEIVKQED